MGKNLSKREFLKLLALGAGGGIIWGLNHLLKIEDALAEQIDPKSYLPMVVKSGSTSTPTTTPTVKPTSPANGPLIVDHTAVNLYQNIPQEYIDKVKKMWIDVPGESHSEAYRVGCQLLQAQDSRFQVNVTEAGTPEGYTDQHLRISRATWGDSRYSSGWVYDYGEEDWYTSPKAIQRTKDHLAYCNTHNLEIAAMGFIWCWDMTQENGPGGTIDPIYQVRWAGCSYGGPDGSLRWGLDESDYDLTGNHICMNSYLNATLQYMDHCKVNNYPTRLFFTTGPVDSSQNTGENGYQRYLKHEYIRNFVKTVNDGVLFDYADILCWSDLGQQNTTTWMDYGDTLRTFPIIHDDNLLKLDGTSLGKVGHIGERGALRLAKALWWMLACLSGWDGN